MELKEIMDQQVFAVAGNTQNPEKFAAKIKMCIRDSSSAAPGTLQTPP